MPRPSRCANVSDMAIGMELYTNSREEISTDDEYGDLP
jgi:hypothetical protein